MTLQHNKPLEITAVVLNWKRLSNVKVILRKMLRRDFIKEIIVWNNNPKPINLVDLNLHNDQSIVKIINSTENLKDKAKYLAASQAKFDHIFYQDDDWNTAHYLDAIYASYCINPDRFHVVIGELSWAENCFRSFHNNEIGIQSQFCFMGVGAMFPKHIALKHLENINRHLENEEAGYADYCLTLWLNQPFIRLQVGINGLSQENAFSSQPEFNEITAKVRKKSIDLLPNFSQIKKPLPETHIKSVFRSLLLFSNYIPQELENVETFYDPKNLDSSYVKMENRPSNGVSKKFRLNPYFSALHITEGKCWKTEQKKGQTWGVWLLKPDNINLNIVSLDSDSSNSLWEVSVDGHTEEYTYQQLKGFEQTINNELKVTLLSKSAAIGVQIISENSSK